MGQFFGGNFLRNSAHFGLSARLAVKKTFLALNVPKLPGFGAGRLEKWPEICVGWSSKRPGSERFKINEDHPKRSQMYSLQVPIRAESRAILRDARLQTVEF